jgi:predicted transcriptional regulator
MSTQVTITLSDEVYRRAERFARLANQDVLTVLANTIDSAIPLVSDTGAALEPMAELTDEQVIAFANLQLEPSQDARLSELLDQQQAGRLDFQKRDELTALMQVYQEGLLRKATALSEAVKRGLREPLDS